MFVNVIMNNMAAGVKTDMDRMVVMATLETLEELLKALKGGWFEMETKALEGLVVSIDDILANKVTKDAKRRERERERERKKERKREGNREQEWFEV